MAELKRITWLGGMNEIGASSALVEALDDLGNSRNVMIDSGMRMRNDYNFESFSEGHVMPQTPVHVILATHAHFDHVGNMPYVVTKNPQAAIFMTRPTLYTTSQVFLSTIHRMGQEIPKNDPGDAMKMRMVMFSESARAIIVDNKLNAIEKPGWVNLFPGIDAYFGPNGHIRGSAFIVLKVGGKMVMFSGDISIYDSPTVKGMPIPEEFVGKLDALFMESTYGNREFLGTRAEEEDRMAVLVKETMALGGSSLAQAFGIGRSPDALLAQLIRNVGDLFLDGAGRRVLQVYSSPEGSWCELDHSSGVDLVNDPRIQMVRDRSERLEIMYSDLPFSVVSTAGMMIPGSCAWQYATTNHFLNKPQNLVLQTGYQAENTPGRALKEASLVSGAEVNLGGYKTVVRARVEEVGLSSHASGMQLAQMVIALNPKKTFINHGTDEGREGLRTNLLLLGHEGEVHKPKNLEVIEF